MLPKIKDSISVIYRRRKDGYEVNFLLNASGSVLPFHLNETAFRCLRYLDGTHSSDQISRLASVEAAEVEHLVGTLRKARLLETGRDEIVVASRFVNQAHFFAEYETATLSRAEMQRRVETAKVAVIGLGGIGSWVVHSLALAGVTDFTIVDPDTVEEGNLARQCLYRLEDIGTPKVEAMQRRLLAINPSRACTIRQARVTSQRTCWQLVRGADLVINCADEPATETLNRIVTAVCYPRSIPHILCGGYDGHLGFLGPTVVPPKSGCWHCYEATLDRQQRAAGYEHLAITPAHIEGGSLGSIAAIIANYHALEAIKVVSGCCSPALIRSGAELDFRTLTINFRRYRRRHACPVCGTKGKNER